MLIVADRVTLVTAVPVLDAKGKPLDPAAVTETYHAAGTPVDLPEEEAAALIARGLARAVTPDAPPAPPPAPAVSVTTERDGPGVTVSREPA